MPQFFDYDPHSGVTQYFDYDEETGEATIHSYQDVEGFLELAQKSRINGLRDNGIRESWFHYASIPAIYQMKLRRIGLDVGNPGHVDRILAHINTHWPELKFTDKNEGGKVKQTFLLTP